MSNYGYISGDEKLRIDNVLELVHGKHVGIKQPIHLILVDLLVPEIILIICHGTGHSSISNRPNELDVFEVSSTEPLDDEVITDRLQWSDADPSTYQ